MYHKPMIDTLITQIPFLSNHLQSMPDNDLFMIRVNKYQVCADFKLDSSAESYIHGHTSHSQGDIFSHNRRGGISLNFEWEVEFTWKFETMRRYYVPPYKLACNQNIMSTLKQREKNEDNSMRTTRTWLTLIHDAFWKLFKQKLSSTSQNRTL